MTSLEICCTEEELKNIHNIHIKPQDIVYIIDTKELYRVICINKIIILYNEIERKFRYI